MEKQRKRNNESHISQIVVISLFIECFGVAAIFECSFLNFSIWWAKKKECSPFSTQEYVWWPRNAGENVTVLTGRWKI